MDWPTGTISKNLIQFIKYQSDQSQQSLLVITIFPKKYLNTNLLDNTFIINKITQMADHNQIIGMANGPNPRPNRYELDWVERDRRVITGQTEFTEIRGIQSLLQELIRQFNQNRGVRFQGEFQQAFEKRFILVEHQLDGLLRKNISIQSNIRDGMRHMDYHQFINETEARNIELQKENQNLKRLRGIEGNRRGEEYQAEINQLKFQIQRLKEEITVKNDLIRRLQHPGEYGPSDQARIHLEIMNLPEVSHVKKKYLRGQEWWRHDKDYLEIVKKLDAASKIYISQINELRRRYPESGIHADPNVLEILKSRDTIIRQSDDIRVIIIQKSVTVTKNVPGHDSNSMAILQALAVHLNKLHTKYPKLKAELSTTLTQLFTSEIISLIEYGEIDSVVKIVEYVPQIVKVENVYAYSSEKSRKVEFHLRILLKALLEEIAKAKAKNPNLALEIDEGVIGMIQTQIMGTVNVDDILKVYRPVPKTEQVQVIMEKVVDRIVRIPQKIQVHTNTNTPVQVQKVVVVKDQTQVPFIKQVLKSAYQQKLVIETNTEQQVVAYPQVHERLQPYKEKEIQVHEVPVYIEKIVEVEKVVRVPGDDKVIIQKELQIRQIPKEVNVYIEKVIQIIKEVPVYVQKIVERVIQREKIVPVQVIVEKIVKQVVYEKAPEMFPVVDTRVDIVPQIREKIVTIEKIVPSIQVVTQYVQKIVEVEHRIQVPTVVEVIKEVVKIIKEPVYVEVPVHHVQQNRVQVPVQVPVQHTAHLRCEVVRVQKQVHQVPVVHTEVNQVHVPVDIQQFVPILRKEVVQVIKSIPYIIKEETPIFFREDHKEFYEIIRQVIKEIPTCREKIVEKIVQVPKTVQIEKIIEKIVVVPRIVQKIVPVPQYIDKIVEVEVQVPVLQPAKEIYIDRPVRVQVPIEIITEKIVYVQQEIAKEVIKNVPIKGDTKTIHTVETRDMIKERIVVQKQEIPRDLIVEKVVNLYNHKQKIVFVDKVQPIPIEVAVPIIYKQNVLIQKNIIKQRAVEVPMVAEKIIPLETVLTQLQVVPQIHEKVVLEQKNHFHQIQKPYFQTQIKQVQLVRQKPITAYQREQIIKEVFLTTDKIVQTIKQIPKIIQVTQPPRIQILKEKQIVEVVKYHIININKYIEKLVDKIIQIPQIVKEIQIMKEHHYQNVPGPANTTQKLTHTQIQVPVEVIREKEKVITQRINHIEQVLKTVTEVIQKDREPIFLTHDRIIEVPMVLQKIVEKIIVMPQIVEVLKYVHEVIENQELGLVSEEVAQTQQYRDLGLSLDRDLDGFLRELRYFKNQPSYTERVANIENYLTRFRRFIQFPQLYEKMRTVPAPVQRVVLVPGSESAQQKRASLLKAIINDKLIEEIRKLQRNYNIPNNAINPDLAFLLGYQFGGKAKDASAALDKIIKQNEQRLRASFHIDWNSDHGEMIQSLFEERMFLSDLSLKYLEEMNLMRKTQTDTENEIKERDEVLKTLLATVEQYKIVMDQIKAVFSLANQHQSILDAYTVVNMKYSQIKTTIKENFKHDNYIAVDYLNKKFIDDIVSGMFHEKNEEIRLLKLKLKEGYRGDCGAIIIELTNIIYRLKEQLQNRGGPQIQSETIERLQREIERLKIQNSRVIQPVGRIVEGDAEYWRLQYQKLHEIHSRCPAEIAAFRNEIMALRDQNRRSKEQISKLNNEILRLKDQLQSPRATTNTNRTINSIVSPIMERSLHNSSDTGNYGQNYQEYVEANQDNVGFINRGTDRYGGTIVSSSYSNNRPDEDGQGGAGRVQLANSAVSYNNRGYQNITNITSPTGRASMQPSSTSNLSGSSGSSQNVGYSSAERVPYTAVSQVQGQGQYQGQLQGQGQSSYGQQRQSQTITGSSSSAQRESYTTSYTGQVQGTTYQSRNTTQTGLTGEVSRTNFYEQKYAKKE